MPYALGVDLGTTFTAAAIARPDGSTEMVGLTPHRPAVPTVVGLDGDQRWLVGEAAERRARTDPDRVAREFKRRIGDEVPVIVAGSSASVEQLLAVVLADVLGTATRAQGEPPTRVAVTHPAAWAQHKQGLLAAAVAAAGIDPSRVDLLAEPVAAARHYASTERVAPGTVLAVYDLGGGTFDAAVLRREVDGFTVLGAPQGIERAGGLDVDQAVLDHVDEALGGALSRFDPDDRSLAGGLAALRDECVRAKEALSSDTDTTVTVALPGLHESVRITRAELEARIGPLLRGTVDALGRAIESAGLTPGDVDRILLVGGSSRLPVVGQLLAARFGRPVVIDAHPKHSIALGAAQAAAGVAFGAPAGPRPPAGASPVSELVPDRVPEPSPGAGRGGRPPLVLLGVVAVLAIVAAAVGVALAGGGDGGSATTDDGVALEAVGDDDDPEATTTTGPTGVTGPGNDEWGFPTRPIDDPGGSPVAGLRQGSGFAGVDPAFVDRVREVDPAVDDVGLVAEIYDAVVAVQLAALTSGHDGSQVAAPVVEATRGGTPCTTPADCIAVVAGGGDPDYDGQTGRIDLSDYGERTTSRFETFELGRTARPESVLDREADLAGVITEAEFDPPTSDVRADDGVLRIMPVVDDLDPPGVVARYEAAAQLAIADVAAAGGIGIPVELAPTQLLTGLGLDTLSVEEAALQGVDAFLVDDFPAEVEAAAVAAGALILQVNGSFPDQLIAERDARRAGEPPIDGGLRFEFGPSLSAYAYMVATLAEADGCRSIALVGPAGDDADLRAEVLEGAMESRSVVVDVRVQPEIDVADDDSVDAAIEEVVDGLADQSCAMWFFPPESEELVVLLAGAVDGGVGPRELFTYLGDGALGPSLVDGVLAIVEG
jgi:actin-like ATPase involved in cell morphogenesis